MIIKKVLIPEEPLAKPMYLCDECFDGMYDFTPSRTENVIDICGKCGYLTDSGIGFYWPPMQFEEMWVAED